MLAVQSERSFVRTSWAGPDKCLPSSTVRDATLVDAKMDEKPAVWRLLAFYLENNVLELSVRNTTQDQYDAASVRLVLKSAVPLSVSP